MEQTKQVRVIETAAYVSELRELTEQGHQVNMVIAGSSMTPFLVNERDSIVFSKPGRALRRGDIVFFQRINGQFICHRIIRAAHDGYYITGDCQIELEGPIQKEQIFGLITKVRRKGKWIGPGDFCWEFFARVWVWMIPFRRPLMRLYAAGKRLLSRRHRNQRKS